ncbi:CopD family protein [Spiribacter insolitus]|uniref:Copper resistance protein D n=1 Tax=Spiribacter insolitus TaxID=3122417 RepID=A0ABV3T819_9GAMM
MLDGLAVVVRAVFYAGALVAAGSVLCLWLLSTLPAAERERLRMLTPIAGLVALVAAGSGVALEAVFLAGNDWGAALDTELIGFILDGPKGLSLAVLVAGLILSSLIWLRRLAADWLALAGVFAIAISFGLTGHTWTAPDILLNALVALHVLLLSFWLGVFVPLYRMSRGDPLRAGAVAHQFGRQAVWAVAGLAAAGLITLHQLTGGLLAALATLYGQIFAVKLSLFVLVMGFAAYNRLRLTPALLCGDPAAPGHLRASLVLESGLLLGILLVTATVTTVTGPGAS